MPEPWLTALETALFAHLPADEKHWQYDGAMYDVERALVEERGQLYFTESWSDMRTHKVKGNWRLSLEAGAFVGIPDWLLARSVEVLVQAIARERPKPKTLTEPAPFDPGRFAASEGRRHRL